MTLKKYHKIRLLVVVVVAMLISQSLVLNNFFIPLVTVVVSSLTLMFLRRRVTEVIADERDYQLGGKSAMLAIQIYSWVAAVIMFILYSLRATNPAFEPVAITLAYSTCLLMATYSLVFKFHDHLKFSKNKVISYFLIAFLIAVATIFTLRLFSGEDNWVCQNGQWVKHGQPSFPAPTSICK